MYRLYYFKITDGPRQPDVLLGIFNANEENNPQNAAEFQKIVDYPKSRLGYLKSEEFTGNVYTKGLEKLFDDIALQTYRGVASSVRPRPPSRFYENEAKKAMIYAQLVPTNTFLVLDDSSKWKEFPIHYICGVNKVDKLKEDLSWNNSGKDVYLLRHTWRRY